MTIKEYIIAILTSIYIVITIILILFIIDSKYNKEKYNVAYCFVVLERVTKIFIKILVMITFLIGLIRIIF